MGLSRDALFAGNIPKIIPTKNENVNASTIENTDIVIGHLESRLWDDRSKAKTHTQSPKYGLLVG